MSGKCIRKSDIELCEVVKHIPLTDSIFDMTFKAKKTAPLIKNAGRFVHIKCDGMTLRRPISICEYTDSTVRIVYEVKGDGTKWLSTLKVGDIIDVLMPLGNGYEHIENKKDTIIISGGIGTPPMVGLLKDVERETAHTIIGFRSKSNAVLIDDFSSLCNNITVCSDDGTIGQKGLVTKFLDNELQQRVKLGRTTSEIFACGPIPMLKAVVATAKKYDIPCRISLEERMGCGIGACLVCACKIHRDNQDTYEHVCIDGPVFNGKDVIFE